MTKLPCGKTTKITGQWTKAERIVNDIPVVNCRSFVPSKNCKISTLPAYNSKIINCKSKRNALQKCSKVLHWKPLFGTIGIVKGVVLGTGMFTFSLFILRLLVSIHKQTEYYFTLMICLLTIYACIHFLFIGWTILF